MKTLLFMAFAGMVLVVGACTPMFMVGKGGSEKRGIFFGSTSKEMYDLMCATGGLEKVLKATHLSKEMKDAFYKYNCSAERSGQKLRELYASMTVAEGKDIKTAFKKNGYSINGGSC